MNDRTKAMALAIAERKVIAMGWKFGAEDIGAYAALIVKALESGLEPKP